MYRANMNMERVMHAASVDTVWGYIAICASLALLSPFQIHLTEGSGGFDARLQGGTGKELMTDRIPHKDNTGNKTQTQGMYSLPYGDFPLVFPSTRSFNPTFALAK